MRTEGNASSFQKVIQRHYWLKRHAIIDQAKKVILNTPAISIIQNQKAFQWLVEMKRDAMEAEKSGKRKDSVSFDTIYTPFAQVSA